MLKKILILMLTLLPSAALALPSAPAQSGAYTVSSALLDKVTQSSTDTTLNKTQHVNGYVMDFHDDKYQYSQPMCAEVSLVEVGGQSIEPGAFVAGDTLVVSVTPNSATATKACISRVVRQQIGRGASGGECLQNFQVKHDIENSPDRLFIGTEYVYHLTAYTRPTLDCDAKAYGASPITTVVAPSKPFLVTLLRDGQETMRWTLSTDTAGQAQFLYTFKDPSDHYRFKVQPGGNAVAGDDITWDTQVADPHPSPSPAATTGGFKLSPLPIVIVLLLVFAAGGAAEYRHWVKKQREHELPEQEYNRSPKL